MRTRKAVSLAVNPAQPDPTLLWYSRAIGIMRARKFVDPTSWRFQGAVHDYKASTDPYKDPNDPPPKDAALNKYARQCQHASWFFLPWHRMYLYHFEQIVADAVVEAGGPPEWALPFWDYTASAEARKLPWAFGQATWPGGETNHLFVAQRATGINARTAALDAADVETATALAMTEFSTAPSTSDVKFGGPRVKNHDGGAFPFGGVESSPHNHVHVAVGGPTGFMIDPTTAALDPIFWLHHANIDRLWEVWIRQPDRDNPTEAMWSTGTKFPFFDAKKKAVTMTCSQVVNTAKLGYAYEGLPLPFKRVKPPRLFPIKKPWLLGATTRPFSLKATHHVSIATPPAEQEGPHERVLLHLEGLTARTQSGSYDVYVNVPSGADETGHPERLAGRISLFGAQEADRKARAHARAGFSFVLDITGLYKTLAVRGEWDVKKLRVTLRPVYDWSDKVTVGRISVNVA